MSQATATCYSTFAGPTRTQAQIDIEHNFCTKYLNISGEEILWDLSAHYLLQVPTLQSFHCRTCSGSGLKVA